MGVPQSCDEMSHQEGAEDRRGYDLVQTSGNGYAYRMKEVIGRYAAQDIDENVLLKEEDFH